VLRFICFICVFCINLLFSQEPTESLLNSGGDSLFFISKGDIYCGNTLSYTRANGIHTSNDGYLSFEELEHNLARPIRNIVWEYLTLAYALDEHWILSTTIPYQLKDQFIFHPTEGYERFYSNTDEQAELGDLRLNLFRHTSLDSVTLVSIRTGLKMRNAKWEEGGQGSGQSDYIFGVSLGQLVGKRSAFHLNGSYTYTDIRRYSVTYSWQDNYHYYSHTADFIFNPGNILELGGGLSTMLTRNLLVGINANLYNQSEYIDRADEIKDSAIRAAFVSTELSYRPAGQKWYTTVAATKLVVGQNVLNAFSLNWGIYVFL